MPHAALWQPSDWSFAPDTIEIAARFYEGGKATYASELRYRFRRVRIARTMEESAGLARLRKGAGDESEGGRLPGGQGHDYRTA
jgi:hypothetical protein